MYNYLCVYTLFVSFYTVIIIIINNVSRPDVGFAKILISWRHSFWYASLNQRFQILVQSRIQSRSYNFPLYSGNNYKSREVQRDHVIFYPLTVVPDKQLVLFVSVIPKGLLTLNCLMHGVPLK